MSERKDLMNEAYEAVLVTVATVAISMASKKLLKQSLTDAKNLEDTAKLAVGVVAGTMIVKYAQNKKWLPVDPFKE